MKLAGAEAVTSQPLLAQDPTSGQRKVRLDGGEHQDRPLCPALLELSPVAPRVAPELVLRHDMDGRAEAMGERVGVTFLDEQPAIANRQALVETRLHNHPPPPET
jgi:hypothetical protein